MTIKGRAHLYRKMKRANRLFSSKNIHYIPAFQNKFNINSIKIKYFNIRIINVVTITNNHYVYIFPVAVVKHCYNCAK